jgi:predicted TIM-barrel fold metal-dependent hydrolase
VLDDPWSYEIHIRTWRADLKHDAAMNNPSWGFSTEAPLEPELPICDAHHHLWERGGERYLLTDFLEDTGSGHNIVATVAVECKAKYHGFGPEELKPLGETEFLESVAKCVSADPGIATAVAAAIVGFADLSLGDGVAAVLEAHMAASPGRFRGIRHSTTWDASESLRSEAPRGLMSEGSFHRGFACLKRYNLSYDAWLYHPQLSELGDLARAFPDVNIILDHIGAPLGVGPYAAKRDEGFDLWRKGIAQVAACPNVAVKLGGLGSDRSGFGWHGRVEKPSSKELAAAMKPYFEFCIEKFGVHRCMFESNFPVEKRANSYVLVWNAFKRITMNYSESERAALFYLTAARIYRFAAQDYPPTAVR